MSASYAAPLEGARRGADCQSCNAAPCRWRTRRPAPLPGNSRRIRTRLNHHDQPWSGPLRIITPTMSILDRLAEAGLGYGLNHLQGPHDAVQPLSHFGGHLRDLGILDELEHGTGVHELDVHHAIFILANHHVAGQQQAD